MDPKVGQTIKVGDTPYGASYEGILAKIVTIDLRYVGDRKREPNFIRAELMLTKDREVIFKLDGENPRRSIILGPGEYEIIEQGADAKPI